jgi:hypothetical protein
MVFGKRAAPGKTTNGGYQVQVVIFFLKITIGANGDYRFTHSIIEMDGPL